MKYLKTKLLCSENAIMQKSLKSQSQTLFYIYIISVYFNKSFKNQNFQRWFLKNVNNWVYLNKLHT